MFFYHLLQKVSWYRLDSQQVLTIKDQVVTKNPRIKVKQDDQSWLLFIKNVTLEDNGYYLCKINTDVPISQIGFLNVISKFLKLTYLAFVNQIVIVNSIVYILQ